MSVNELSVSGFEKSLSLPSRMKANNAQMKIAWYNKKGVVILLHSLAWIAIFTLPFLIRTSNNDSHKPPFEIGYLYFYIVTKPFWIGFFYLNALYLFPQLISRKKYLLYVGSQFLSLFILSVIHSIWFNIFIKRTPYEIAIFFFFNIFVYFFLVGSCLAYRVIIFKI